LALECLRSSDGAKGSAVRGFSREAIRVMREYQWPGNVRELFNRVQGALIMCENRLITPADLGLHRRINGQQLGATLKDARATMDENIVRMALQSPIRQIAENAGVEGSIVVGKVMDERSGSFGYDAQVDEYGDMIEKGIVDPAKVVRIALQDAASIAGLMITTEAGVAEAPQKEAGAGHAKAAWAA